MKNTCKCLFRVVFLLLIPLNSFAQTCFVWGRQYGTEKEEYVMGHVIDQKGNVYVSGWTAGDIAGKNAGMNDGFITKYDSTGNVVWSKQFGSVGDENITWSAIDHSGNIYITGSTTSDLGGKNAGKEDVFLAKYNSEGKLEWIKQTGSDSTDVANGVCTDKNGYIYLTGQTLGKIGKASYGNSDAFLIKLDASGNMLFKVQAGTPLNDFGMAVTADENNGIYICGSTMGAMASVNKGIFDAFVSQFNDKGDLVRSFQFGTEGVEMALQILTDDKQNIYVAGTTTGDMEGKQAGDGDSFLSAFNAQGENLWTRQFGTVMHDGVRGITCNTKVSDGILISGLQGLPFADSYLRMYKKDGTLLWERDFKNCSGKSVTIDDSGNIYHNGLTKAGLFGKNAGSGDYYLVKLSLDNNYRNH